MKRSVCLIGIFPPPLHGMSLISDFVKNRISVSATPLVVDYSPRSLDRSLIVRFSKSFRVLLCLFQFLSYLLAQRVGAVYLGLSGGNGQAYDAMFVGVSRVFGRKLYLHHHGYQYLDRQRWLSRLVFLIAGKNAVHIVACERMASDLTSLYPVVTRVKVISGIAALEPWESNVIPRKQIRTIGFLSNISIEKGIHEFLDIASWAGQAKLPIHFLLAGPYHDDEIKRLVEGRLADLKNVIRIGAVYGVDKLAFFDSIDVFLLPSHNESEGLVIHEAMSRGVPVIAYSRGCIEQIVSDAVGMRLAPAADYVSGAVSRINEWLLHPDAFELVSQASVRRFNEARSLHARRMDDLCDELIYGRSS